jgi:hypothetical protein
MSDIARQYSNVRFSPNIFTPYPGIPIWPQLRELGVEEPKTLAAWGDLALGINMLPWLKGTNLNRFNLMLSYFLLNAQLARSGKSRHKGIVPNLIRLIVSQSVRWRIQKNRYSLPWEIWFAPFTERIVMRRSLITGKELPTEAINAC